MRNITQQWNGKLTIPPAYFDPSEYLSQVSKVQPNNELRKSAELIISKLHDIGILQLSNVQESDFLLNPAITISEMIEIENDLEARKEELFLFESAISFTSSKKLSDLSAHKVAFDSQFMLSINFQNVEDEIDMLLDDELSVGPGSSGAPIVHRVEGNQFLVLGIVTGNFPWVEVEKDGKIIHPTIYLPVSPLLPHLADRQDLFYRNAVPACRTLTRITTERRYVKK